VNHNKIDALNQGCGVGFLTTLELESDFLSDSDSPTESFFTSHSYVRSPNSCLLKWYNFFRHVYWNRILAVHHDFHWLLVVTKFATFSEKNPGSHEERFLLSNSARCLVLTHNRFTRHCSINIAQMVLSDNG